MTLIAEALLLFGVKYKGTVKRYPNHNKIINEGKR
jgi:hypothetical protein